MKEKNPADLSKRSLRLPVLGTAVAALVAVSGCSILPGGGDDDAAGGFVNITNEIAVWDMCEVLPIEPIKEQLKAETYMTEPHHVGLGSSMDAEAISCFGDIYITYLDDYTSNINVTLSVFPGVSPEHVD